MVKNGRVQSAMSMPMHGGVFLAMFQDGLNYVPDHPLPIPVFKKMRAKMRQTRGVYDYRSKTPEEFAALAVKAGAAKKYSAAFFRKEIAFLADQISKC